VVCTFAVVSTQVSCIGRRLIEIGQLCATLALEFQHQYGAADQQDDVWTPVL
jgi:hypothetical protein